MTTHEAGPHPAWSQRLADSVDRVELRGLIESYADGVTRRAWAEVEGLFVADAELTLSLGSSTHHFVGPGEFTAFIAGALDRFEFFEFVVLGTSFRLPAARSTDSGAQRETAAGRLYMSELRQTADDHVWSQIFGCYEDEFVWTTEGWKFARRSYRSLARRLTGLGEAEIVDS